MNATDATSWSSVMITTMLGWLLRLRPARSPTVDACGTPVPVIPTSTASTEIDANHLTRRVRSSMRSRASSLVDATLIIVDAPFAIVLLGGESTRGRSSRLETQLMTPRSLSSIMRSQS